MKAEIERLIIAAHGQGPPIRNFQSNLIKSDQTQYVELADKKLN